MMRIHVVNPNASDAMTAGIAAAAELAAPPGATIITTGAEGGPESIEGPVDGALAVPWLLRRIEQAEATSVDAHVIACFDDTGLDAARCVARAPVVGIGEAAAHCATMLADRFAIITSVPEALSAIRNETRAAIHEDGADAIVLGCAGMARLAAALSDEFDCPVIEGISAGLALAGALAGTGLRTSKLGGYAAPRQKAAP